MSNRDLIERLKKIQRDPIEDLIDKMEGLEERQTEFASIVAQHIEATEEALKGLKTSVEILQNKSSSVSVKTGGTEFNEKVERANVNTGKGTMNTGDK